MTGDGDSKVSALSTPTLENVTRPARLKDPTPRNRTVLVDEHPPGAKEPVDAWVLAWKTAFRERLRRKFSQGSESLATARQEVGEVARALVVLEEAAGAEPRYGGNLFWGASGRFRVQARLAGEYRAAGRIDEAMAIEDDVLHMLKYSDADHPIVLQIKEARQASTVKTQAQ